MWGIFIKSTQVFARRIILLAGIAAIIITSLTYQFFGMKNAMGMLVGAVCTLLVGLGGATSFILLVRPVKPKASPTKIIKDVCLSALLGIILLYGLIITTSYFYLRLAPSVANWLALGVGSLLVFTITSFYSLFINKGVILAGSCVAKLKLTPVSKAARFFDNETMIMTQGLSLFDNVMRIISFLYLSIVLFFIPINDTLQKFYLPIIILLIFVSFGKLTRSLFQLVTLRLLSENIADRIVKSLIKTQDYFSSLIPPENILELLLLLLINLIFTFSLFSFVPTSLSIYYLLAGSLVILLGVFLVSFYLQKNSKIITKLTLKYLNKKLKSEKYSEGLGFIRKILDLSLLYALPSFAVLLFGSLLWPVVFAGQGAIFLIGLSNTALVISVLLTFVIVNLSGHGHDLEKKPVDKKTLLIQLILQTERSALRNLLLIYLSILPIEVMIFTVGFLALTFLKTSGF